MTGLQKQKARSHLKRFRSREGPHVFFFFVLFFFFFFPSSLFFVSPHRSRLMTGFNNKKEGERKKKKIRLFPGKATGKRFAIRQTKAFPRRDLFPPRQVIRCPHLRDNEATVRLIVNTLHGLLNGLPCQASNGSPLLPPPLPPSLAGPLLPASSAA